MNIINDIIREILDIVFGNVYIATNSDSMNIYAFLCDLIVLTCYIFIDKRYKKNREENYKCIIKKSVHKKFTY